MSEVNQAEILGGSGPAKESQEISFEQFQEDQRRTQQALAQLWKEEGKVKAQDNKLAQIIVRFLNDPANTHLFLLIARVVAQNVPSEFIIAVISLIDKGAHQEIQHFLAAPAEKNDAGVEFVSPKPQSLAIRPPQDFGIIPPGEKAEIDQWVQEMQMVALKMPFRTLDTVAHKPRGAQERQVSLVVIQLASMVLRDFLSKHQLLMDFGVIQDFIQMVLVEIVKKTEAFVAQQKALPDNKK